MKNRFLIFIFMFTALLVSFKKGDWVNILSHDGTFKISFPHRPEEMRHVVDSGLKPVTSRLMKFDVGKYKDDNQVYQLIYSDYSEDLINSDFKERIVDSFLKNIIFIRRDEIKAKLISIEPYTFQGYPGRQIHFSYNGGRSMILMKIMLIKSRLYIIQIECESSNENNPSMKRFFDSFKIIEDEENDKKKEKTPERKRK